VAPEAAAAVAIGAFGCDPLSCKLDDTSLFAFAAIDWTDAIANDDSVDRERGEGDVDDVFEEIIVVKETTSATQIQPSLTWLTRDDDCSFPSLNQNSFRNRDTNSSAVPTRNNANRLWKAVKIMALALVLFIAIAISLGFALIIVAANENNNEKTVTSTVASPMDETVLEPDEIVSEPDETILDSGTTTFINITVPTKFTILPTTATPTSKDPTSSPSADPTDRLSSWPSASPTNHLTSILSSIPSNAPIDPFFFGDFSMTNDELGFEVEVSAGLSLK